MTSATSVLNLSRAKTRESKQAMVSRKALIAFEILSPIVIIAAWWVISSNSKNTFFPPLELILTRLAELAQTEAFWVNVGSSVSNLLISFVLASALGIILGVVLGTLKPLSWLIEPTIHFFRAIPPVALVPIFVSLLGFGSETRILAITLSALFPVLISTVDGVRSVEPTLNMVCRVYRIGYIDRMVSVVIPAASPRILSGMQVSIITAFVVMIASEMLGSSVGLGAATLLAQQSFAIVDMWAGILTLGVLGYAASALFALFRRSAIGWYIASQRQERNS